jgi:hypothetical protein
VKKPAIYSLITLTILCFSLAVTQTALSQTSQASGPDNSSFIKILSYSYYVDQQGLLDAVGEVQNQGPNTVMIINVGGEVYATDGSMVRTGGAQALAAYIAPQQKAPFYMEFPNNDGQGNPIDWYSIKIDRIDLSIDAAPATADSLYSDITFSGKSSTVDTTKDGLGTYWVTGNMQNTGSQTAQGVTVVGTFYNSEGVVVGVGLSSSRVDPAPTIAAGASQSFKFGAWDRNQSIVPSNQKIASYALITLPTGPILSNTNPIVQTTPVPTDSNAPTNTPATVTNNGATDNGGGTFTDDGISGSYTTIIGVLVVVAVVAVVGAVLFMKSRKGNGEDEKKKPVAKASKKPDARAKRNR